MCSQKNNWIHNNQKNPSTCHVVQTQTIYARLQRVAARCKPSVCINVVLQRRFASFVKPLRTKQSFTSDVTTKPKFYTESKALFFDRVEPSLETVSLFSVDQIREEESPWKALTDLSSTTRPIRKASPFKRRLQERKKLRMLYGNLPQRALRHYYKHSNRSEDLLLALESRLDIVLKRSALFPSIQSARKSILQGSIVVNTTTVRSPRFHCTPGDFIKVKQRRPVLQDVPLAKKSIRLAKELNVPSKKKGNLLDLCEFQKLFVFSELVQSWHREAGRLYASTLVDLKSVRLHSVLAKRSFSRFLEKKEMQTCLRVQDNAKAHISQGFVPSTHLQEVPLLRDIDSCESITIPYHLRDAERSSTNTLDHILSEKTSLNKTFHTRGSTKSFEKTVDMEESMGSEQPLSKAIASRPLHLEVSYRDLCVVFLYPPQRICVDISIDSSLLC